MTLRYPDTCAACVVGSDCAAPRCPPMLRTPCARSLTPGSKVSSNSEGLNVKPMDASCSAARATRPSLCGNASRRARADRVSRGPTFSSNICLGSRIVSSVSIRKTTSPRSRVPSLITIGNDNGWPVVLMRVETLRSYSTAGAAGAAAGCSGGASACVTGAAGSVVAACRAGGVALAVEDFLRALTSAGSSVTDEPRKPLSSASADPRNTGTAVCAHTGNASASGRNAAMAAEIRSH
jgi:hypothetical protein